MAMFDKMAGMAERLYARAGGHGREHPMLGYMHDAARFDFNDGSTVAERKVPDAAYDEPFELPFPVVVIESAIVGVLIVQKPQPSTPEEANADITKQINEIVNNDFFFWMVATDPEGKEDSLDWAKGAFSVHGRTVDCTIQGTGTYSREAGGHVKVDHDPKSIYSEKGVAQAINKTIVDAADDVRYVMQPTRFIFEVSPRKQRANPKKVLRSHERPQFTVLTPSAIKRLYLPNGPADHDGSGEGVKKVPHARRKHWRTLRSDFYVNRKGERVLIPAIWVGQKETVVGNKLYKVRIDL